MHVGKFFDNLGLGRVGVDGFGNGSQPQAVGDGQRKFVDHLSGMSCDNRSAEDSVRTLLEVDPREAGCLTIQDCPINIL
jgi:hypothetical protein